MLMPLFRIAGVFPGGFAAPAGHKGGGVHKRMPRPGRSGKGADSACGPHTPGNSKFGVCGNTRDRLQFTRADPPHDFLLQEAVVPAGTVRRIEPRKAGGSCVQPRRLRLLSRELSRERCR